MESVKARLLEIENGMQVLQECVGKILQLHKDTRANVGNLFLVVGGLKQEGVSIIDNMIL